MKLLVSSLLAPVLAASLSACAASPAAPPVTPTETAATPAEPTKASGDIVQTAADAGSFKTLITAVKAAGLAETLQAKGPFTVFAPTDEAFAKLPPGTVESLLKPENKEKLRAVLSYHVVSGKVGSTEAVKAQKAKTVQGQDLTITAAGGAVKVDTANVVKADIECTNGVIHVIDTVVLPK